MTNDQPWLSVAIPVYNPEQTYLEAIARELAEAASNVSEVILSHDDPNLGLPAEEILHIFRRLISVRIPVRYCPNASRAGMVDNWNRVVLSARGEYVVNLGLDDVLPAATVEAVGTLIRRGTPAVFLAVGRELIGPDGKSLSVVPWVHDRTRIFREDRSYKLEYERVLDLVLRNGQILGEPCCVFLRLPVFRRTGGYSTSYRHAADLELLLRLLQQGHAEMHPYLKAQRRLHLNNLTLRHIEQGYARADRYRLFNQYSGSANADRLGQYEAYLLLHDLVDCWRLCRRGRWALAIATCVRARPAGGSFPLVAVLQLIASLLTRRNPDCVTADGFDRAESSTTWLSRDT